MPADFLSLTPFRDISTEDIVSKLSEPVGDEVLDEIREQTFLSLSSKATPDLSSGINRAIQILYSTGSGFFLTHAFTFNDEWIKKVNPEDSPVEGKSLTSIISDNGQAYSRLYTEYKKRYSSLSYFNPEYIGLAEITRCTPSFALPIIRLLTLILVSTRYEE